MKNLRITVLAALLGLSVGAAWAQAGGGKGPGPMGSGQMGAGPMAAASGPGSGMGPGRGPGAARWGSDFTPGWPMMTAQERNAHREQLRTMKTNEECKAYVAQHHEKMAERAKERGGKAMMQPRRDACAGLKN